MGAVYNVDSSGNLINSGTVQHSSLSTAGVVHNNASGLLSTSLIVNADLATMPTLTFKGNNTGVSATPLDLTVSQMQTALGISAPPLTATQIGFGNASNLLSGSADLTWDNTNKVMNLVTASQISIGNGATGKRRFVANSNVANDFQWCGVGYTGTHQQYQTNSSSANHIFACGASSSTETSLFTVKGSGVLNVTAMSTAGIVHNASSGDLSSSLIVAADITNSTITGTKIASGTVTNSNLANMNAHTFKGNNTGSAGAPLDLTIAQAQTELGLGTMAFQNANAVAITGGSISGTTYSRTISAATDFVLSEPGGVYLQFNTTVGLLQNGGTIQNAQFTSGIVSSASIVTSTLNSTSIGATTPSTAKFTTLTIPGFSTAGVIHNDSAGLFSSSLIVAADITTATITNAKLANMAAHTFKGNNTGSAAAPSDLSIAQMQSELALGTMAFQNANAVAITGGSISAATYSRTISAATDFVLVNAGGVYLQFNTTVGLLQNGGTIQNAALVSDSMTSSNIDSSPIGATTPSTGKFTTLQATTGLTLPTPGGTPTLLDSYEEASATVSVSGPWSAQNLAVTYTRVGRMVTLSWGDLSVAITSASQKILSASGTIPTRFRPASSSRFAEVINGVTNITEAPGVVLCLSGGSLGFATEGGGNFGATGFAGVVAGSVSYIV